MFKKKSAFTLIEVMIVVAILSVMAVIVTADYSKSKSRARDASRKDSVKAYASAVELYYSANKSYAIKAAGCAFAGDISTNAIYKVNCVGFHGNGWGAMTRRSMVGKYDNAKSIADTLVSKGYLNSVKLDPRQKEGIYNVHDNSNDKYDDFLYVICDSSGKQAISEATATDYSVQTKLENSDSNAGAQAQHLCGIPVGTALP